MSKKVDATDAKAETRRERKPKRRFQEFKDALEWEVKSIDDICKTFSGGTPSTSEKKYYGGNIPFIRSAEIAKNETELFLTDEGLANSAAKMVKKGDVLVALYGANSGDVALSKLDGAINQAILCLRSENSNPFVYQFLSFKKNWIISTYIQGGQGNLSGEIVKSIKLGFPSLEEQQKIADCLSSLDELIAAESQRLEHLQNHKKGLMQQLFPLEGETVPKLRFPEFEGTLEWTDENLSKLSSRSLSNGVFNDPKKVGTGYKLINVSDMYIETTINENNLYLLDISEDEFLRNKVENGDIFFTRSSLVKSGIAYSNIYLGTSQDITFDGHLIRFRPNDKIVLPTFIHYLLKTNRVRSQLVARGKTATMTTIGQADVESVRLSFPEIPEQQKIADCLSSTDELIAAQKQKIDLLKTHKKGLMQGLFPAPDEVQE